MLVIGTDLVEGYFSSHASHKGIKAARDNMMTGPGIVETGNFRTPAELKRHTRKQVSLRVARVVFNIKANDYRLIALVDFRESVLMIRFFGSHQEYDSINAETV